MPKEGWRSITIKEDILTKWEDSFKKNKKQFAEHGVTSFTGYVQAIMEGVIEDPNLQIQALKKSVEILYAKT